MTVTVNSIVTPQAPFSRTAVAVTADVAFNAPAATVTLLDRADNINGARISRLYAIPRATIAASLNCLVYSYDGTTKTLIDSALMATVTPGATVANAKTDFGYSEDAAFYVRPGYGLEVAIGASIANGVAFRAEGGFY